MSITRRALLTTAAGAPFLMLGSKAAQRRPNVIFFMTDDHGAWANGAYGCQSMHTPNIDKLAAGGAKFTRAFACTPVCSPSRMTYMTGKMPSHHHVQDWLRPVDSFGPKSRRWLEGHVAYSEVLARNGYNMGMCGKWHMGHDEKPQAGFSYWATVPGGGGPYKDVTMLKNGREVKGDYKTDLVGDCALEFLDQQKADKPFCLQVPFYAPHTPYNYQPDKYRQSYEGSSFGCFPETPVHPWQNPGLKSNHGKRASKHAFSALITGVDDNIGRILKRVEEMGQRENTVVIFTADQGWNAGHHGVWGKGNGTWPFNMLEESLNVPLIWSHPGRIAPGQTPAPMVSSYDFFPTILDYLGLEAPADKQRVGMSYAPYLRGAKPRTSRDRLYFEYSFVRGVRTENMKYIERTKEWPSELFDLEADPGETKNLIGDPAYAKQLAALRADLAGFFKRNGAPPIEDWRSTTTQELTVYSR